LISLQKKQRLISTVILAPADIMTSLPASRPPRAAGTGDKKPRRPPNVEFKVS
jgi:hypothetical protein